MNSNSDQKLKSEQAFKNSTEIKSETKKTDIYDVINSDDLDLLYKKNAHLLSRLSFTGRQNGILQTEVHSLLEEKSKLDVKNNFLKTKVDSLKDQISLFARQQRNFNQQSLRLKKELKGLKISGFELVNERTDIIKDQSSSKKLIHYINYRKKVQKAHKQIKIQIDEMKNRLLDVSAKKEENNLSNIRYLTQEKENKILLLTKKEIVYVNQIKNLEKKYFESKKIQDNQVEDIKNLKVTIESENKNQISSQQEKEKNLHDLIQTLKHQQEDLLKENESYENQVNLYQSYQQENQTLSENYKNLRLITSQQEEGFNQALMSFRKKYIKINNGYKSKSKEAETKSAEVLRLKNLLEQSQKNFEIKKEGLTKTLVAEKQNEIKNLLAELDIKNQQNQDIARKLQNLRDKQKQEFSNLQQEYLDEIQSLKLKVELQSSRFKAEQERSVQSVKNEYELRINNSDISYKKRLQNIKTEMENDFLSERRQSEMFKSMKEKQIKEIEITLEQLQKETHKLKTSNFALENSNRETMSQLKKEISKNEYLITQNKNLHSLWHQIQLSLEKKQQQIQSLQKLNKNLSVSFSKVSSEQKSVKPSHFSLEDKSPSQHLEFTSSDKEESTKNSPLATNHILADIHFD